ncbi:MAG: hypothetical protein IPM66_01870 [Acidobacteriota bacterium]|nr:MAG: hypothetical protein IPM66_01870 [Acidobacteriota bacterium]
MTRLSASILMLGVLIIPGACKDGEPTAPSAPQIYRVDPATAGTISGKIRFDGKRPAPKPIDMDQDPQCARLHQQSVFDDPVSVSADGSLANTFVWIKRGLDDRQFELPADPVVIDQRGCWFGPRVMGVRVGQTFKVLNSDPVTHNIHPLAEINREWNQSQAPGAEPLTRKFARTEVMIRVKCNIHNWMRAWIGVVDHPYFAVTGGDGSFQLNNVPPGTYTIEVWHEALGRLEKQVSLDASGKITADFEFNGD